MRSLYLKSCSCDPVTEIETVYLDQPISGVNSFFVDSVLFPVAWRTIEDWNRVLNIYEGVNKIYSVNLLHGTFTNVNLAIEIKAELTAGETTLGQGVTWDVAYDDRLKRFAFKLMVPNGHTRRINTEDTPLLAKTIGFSPNLALSNIPTTPAWIYGDWMPDGSSGITTINLSLDGFTTKEFVTTNNEGMGTCVEILPVKNYSTPYQWYKVNNPVWINLPYPQTISQITTRWTIEIDGIQVIVPFRGMPWFILIKYSTVESESKNGRIGYY